MFDTARRVKSVKSIAQMPVILGVRRSKAQALGWIGAKVTTRDILAAVEGGRLKFLMTSATQSNSGAAAYLAMLAAGIGKPDLIEAGDLDKSEVLATVRGLLRGVERSSGSSGWLADLYREGERTGAHYEAIWNYEAVIKETNDKLIADRKEPLYAIYPEDGVSVGDSPLGFVDRGRGKEVESFFNDLQAFLLKSETQARIAATGPAASSWAAPPRSRPTRPPISTPAAPLTVVRPPEPAVIQKALALYQEALRRPSLTALCLDVSGSMQGQRRAAAARSDAVPADAGADPRSAGAMVEGGPDHRAAVQRSRAVDRDGKRRREPRRPTLLAKTLQLRAEGGTDFYTCGARALAAMKPFLDRERHLPAIVIMTDGKSQGAMSTFEQAWRADGHRVPVFGVTFGDSADRSQLDNLAQVTGGRVFDGTKSLTQAFRAVRGYN